MFLCFTFLASAVFYMLKNVIFFIAMNDDGMRLKVVQGSFYISFYYTRTSNYAFKLKLCTDIILFNRSIILLCQELHKD